jgi:hypothetical protein
MPPYRRTLVFLALSSGALIAVAGGCVDLFHRTDFSTACELDPLACPDLTTDGSVTDAADVNVRDASDGGDAARGGPTDFCAWSYEQSHHNARRACAWLGACAGAFSDNAFGKCLDTAILAYDCDVNPNRKVIGKAHDFWDCLWQADSCTAVSTCLFAGAPPTCAASVSENRRCSGPTIRDCAANDAAAPPVAAENCTMTGRTCASGNCVGGSTCDDAGATCDTSTHLRDCIIDGIRITDQGQDCTDFGAGACADVDGGTPACRPSVAAGADASCAPSASITCAEPLMATGCATGVRETIDCRRLMEDAGACNESQPGRPWDVARACKASAEQCTVDSCLDSGALRACHRGQMIDVRCAEYGLTACKVSTHFLMEGAACSP